ncbi:MAG: enoyl-CoA hydratase-related protein [Saprospiraceae bacterium]
MNNTLLINNNDGIITITIDRPKAMNAINKDVMEGLNNWFSEEYKSFGKIKGVIITGNGDKAFAAGADIKEFTDLDQKTGAQKSKYGHETYFFIENFHRPVIAAVNGFALGGGCELAMTCHIRIASENAKFGQPEVNLGLVPGYGGTQRLVQLIGKAKTLELLLTGDMIDSESARNLGLVNHVVEQSELLNKCNSMINKIAKKGPLSVTKCIEAVNTYFDKTKDGFLEESKIFGMLLASEECKEGVSAFIEKRKPDF